MQLFVRYPPIKLSIKQPLLNSLNKIILRSSVLKYLPMELLTKQHLLNSFSTKMLRMLV